jgi:TusA-related sulfurtransferase
MHSQEAHIVTRCQWNTAFDSKQLAHQLQTDISSWSAYKMKRVMTSVFDSICPKGQTLKIRKLAVDLGSITYENLMSELPLRLEEALRNALYDLILYPKNGDKTLEIIHEDVAQISVLRDFLMQGILPWNYQESYGTAVQIMDSQLNNNRLDVIQMIQEIGTASNVRKRIAWQFPDVLVKKIIIGLEPNNHQQIIDFSDEFVKVQEKETIVQTSTNDLKKNIWLWILNYLFTERGTIFNRIAFVRSTVTQMASHFNISYDAMIELIENAIERATEYSQVDKGFIAILKLLSEEVKNTSFSRIKTKKQEENYWSKVETYFYNASARTAHVAKNEFNELVINLSKLDAKRFQKIILKVEQKPVVWKGILKDLIPAAVENLFLALSPSESKNVLQQISFLSKLPQTTKVHIDTLDLYTFGIDFCITHQHTSVAKTAFLDFVIEKLVQQKQQDKLALLEHFVGGNSSQEQKEVSFLPLFQELHSLYQKEISHSKNYTSEAVLQQVLFRYATELQRVNYSTTAFQSIEKTLQKWMTASPEKFWNATQQLEKTPTFTKHISALVTSYGTAKFVNVNSPKMYALVVKIEQILALLISKHAKQASSFRAIKNELFSQSFQIIWEFPKASEAEFFTKLLQRLVLKQYRGVSQKELFEALNLLVKTPKIRTLSWSNREFVSIQKQYNVQKTQTPLEAILDYTSQSNQQLKVAEKLSVLVRQKQMTTREFQQNENMLISYLLVHDVQLKTRLIAKFAKKILATKTTFSETRIKTLLHELFWQTLAHYESYRGDVQKFSAFYKKTVFQTFPELKKEAPKEASAHKKNREKVSLQTPYQISVATLFEAIRVNLETATPQFEIAQKSYDFTTIYKLGLETSPAQMRAMLQEINITKKQRAFLKQHISFDLFVAFFANDVSGNDSHAFKAIYTLFHLAKQLGTAQIINALQTKFWKQTIALLQQKQAEKTTIKMLVDSTFEVLSSIATLDQITIVKHIQNNHIAIPELLRIVLLERHQIFELIYQQQPQISLSKALKTYQKSGKIELLSNHLITKNEIPAWFVHAKAYSYEQLVNELVAQQPLIVLKTIRSVHFSEAQWTRFVQTIHVEPFISTLQKLYTAPQKDLANLLTLYETFAFVNIRGISTKDIQEIILKKVVVAWRASNWSLIASTQIWNELLWEICGKKSVHKKDFFKAIDSAKTMLPTALLVTYKSLLSNEKATQHIYQKEHTINIKNDVLMEQKESSFPDEGVSIRNAGLVILNSYFLMLLERLEIVKDKAFVSEEAQLDAIHYLQYIVTGHTQTEESLLALNKVLVGISPETPVKDSIEMTESQKELINGLIQAAINYWPEIGQTSVDGFRGNWLVRDGILRETEDRWELLVEKRPYDVLMIKSPFSFSIIKLPWMDKPLHVTWPF